MHRRHDAAHALTPAHALTRARARALTLTLTPPLTQARSSYAPPPITLSPNPNLNAGSLPPPRATPPWWSCAIPDPNSDPYSNPTPNARLMAATPRHPAVVELHDLIMEVSRAVLVLERIDGCEPAHSLV